MSDDNEGPTYRLKISKKALDLLCELLQKAGCEADWHNIGTEDEVALSVRWQASLSERLYND